MSKGLLRSLLDISSEDLTSEEHNLLLELASAEGLQMRIESHLSTHLPISLLPSPVSSTEFHRAKTAMFLFNKLVDRIARDREWLHTHLDGLDEFTTSLLSISKACVDPKQRIYLGIHRSDYMFDEETQRLLQVEINTISSSFGAMATKLVQLHEFALVRFAQKFSGADVGNLPENNALAGVAEALFQARQLEGSNGAVLVVVGAQERNVFDQHMVELELWRRFRVLTIRATLGDISHNFVIDPITGIGCYRNQVISVVYYRTGYSPNDYPGPAEWKARLLLEQSAAIKCPSIDYHLAGVKKIQQLLCLPEHLNRFIPDEAEQKLISSFFTTIIGLDQRLSQEFVDQVRGNPSAWVLKPMREGGGNNVYDEKITQAFQDYETNSAVVSNLKGFILMKKIVPKPHRVLMARQGVVRETLGVWEFGTFGAYISDGQTEYLNAVPGHLLRTKSIESNEGGVAAGYAVVDSPYLV